MITLIQRGPNVTRNNAINWVYAPCDQLIVGYWCETHQVQMPNREAAVDHCGEPGDHAIARWCTTHGFEAPHPREHQEKSA
jgi:hypothetical protein